MQLLFPASYLPLTIIDVSNKHLLAASVPSSWMMFFIIAPLRLFVKLCAAFLAVDVIQNNFIKIVVAIILFVAVSDTALRTEMLAIS